jgi:hypothetical protein
VTGAACRVMGSRHSVRCRWAGLCWREGGSRLLRTLVLRKRSCGPAPAVRECAALRRESPSGWNRREPVAGQMSLAVRGFRANTKATQARGPGEDQHWSNTDKTAFPGIRRHW